MADLHKQLAQKFPQSVLEIHADHGDETALVKKEAVHEIAKFLKTDPVFDFNVLIDLTAVDGLLMKWKPRFQVVYHFYSLKHNHRLRLKTAVDLKDLVVPSLADLWPVANWFEREVFDLFGIRFENHPDLRRILLYEGFEGHPLRKDYPVNKRQPLIGPKN